jgi:ADP-heptose:LPS heptosyltransferase
MNLCGKTTFGELLVLLKMAHYHIDSECGMVHLRHFLSAKPSIVLFGPTKKDFYAYPENINISSDICIGCEWIHERWRTQCLKTGDKAMCLKTIQPLFVVQKIREYEDVHNKRI